MRRFMFFGIPVAVAVISVAITLLVRRDLNAANQIAGVISALLAAAALVVAARVGRDGGLPIPASRVLVATVLVAMVVPPVVIAMVFPSHSPKPGTPAVARPPWRSAGVLVGHNYVVNSLSFSPDNRTLAACDLDGVRLWDVRTQKQVATFTTRTTAEQAVFRPDGNRVAIGDTEGDVQVWALDEAKRVKTFASRSEDDDWVEWVRYSPDNDRIMIGYSSDHVVVRTNALGRQVISFRDVESAEYFPDGQQIALGESNLVRVVSADTGSTVVTLPATAKTVATVSASATRIAANAGDNVEVWDVATGARTTLTGPGGLVRKVLFSPDGALLAAGTRSGALRLWDAATGEVIATLTGHTASIYALAFTGTGLLASAGKDHTIHLWTT